MLYTGQQGDKIFKWLDCRLFALEESLLKLKSLLLFVFNKQLWKNSIYSMTGVDIALMLTFF